MRFELNMKVAIDDYGSNSKIQRMDRFIINLDQEPIT